MCFDLDKTLHNLDRQSDEPRDGLREDQSDGQNAGESPAPLGRLDLWRNLIAMLYDTFLVAPLLMANAFVLVAVYGPTADATSPTVPAWLMQAMSVLIVIAFFTLFWRKSGQSLGMQAWRIKVVSATGETVSLEQCVIRCLGAGVSLAAFGLGYWWVLVDKQGLRWHDRLSGTRLVKLPKRAKA